MVEFISIFNKMILYSSAQSALLEGFEVFRVDSKEIWCNFSY